MLDCRRGEKNNEAALYRRNGRTSTETAENVFQRGNAETVSIFRFQCRPQYRIVALGNHIVAMGNYPGLWHYRAILLTPAEWH